VVDKVKINGIFTDRITFKYELFNPKGERAGKYIPTPGSVRK